VLPRWSRHTAVAKDVPPGAGCTLRIGLALQASGETKPARRSVGARKVAVYAVRRAG